MCGSSFAVDAGCPLTIAAVRPAPWSTTAVAVAGAVALAALALAAFREARRHGSRKGLTRNQWSLGITALGYPVAIATILAGVNAWPAEAGSIAGRDEDVAAVLAVVTAAFPWITDRRRRALVSDRLWVILGLAGLALTGVLALAFSAKPDLSLAIAMVAAIGLASATAPAAATPSDDRKAEVVPFNRTFGIIVRHTVVLTGLGLMIVVDIALRRSQ